MFKSSSTPKTVPTISDNPQDPLSDYQPGDVVGAFSGYLRRAKPSKEGLTAQIFGENGHDADIISTMHLTRFQEAPVRVRIFMVKDHQGRLKQQFLCEFIAKIKRPSANDQGQVAQFFGDNGPNADAVNILNQSAYLDALVFVELRKPEEREFVVLEPLMEPPEGIEEEAKRMVPSELKQLKKQQRVAEEGITLLRREGFFLLDPVLACLGKEPDYTQWISSQGCCHPGQAPCGLEPVQAFRLPHTHHLKRPYEYVPLCHQHLLMWQQGESGIQAPEAFLDSQRKRHNQLWAQQTLRQVLGVPDGFSPMPAPIHAWTMDHGLQRFLPTMFLTLLGTQ